MATTTDNPVRVVNRSSRGYRWDWVPYQWWNPHHWGKPRWKDVYGE